MDNTGVHLPKLILTHIYQVFTVFVIKTTLKYIISDQIRSVAQSCPTLCDPMNHSMPGLLVHHQLLEFTQTQMSIESVMPSSHLILCRPLLLLPPIPPSISLFQWVNSSHEVDSILKSRDITLRTKVHLVKAMIFPVDMYECESWTIKKAERWRIDSFELWCWIRLLRVPWTARRFNQSILKNISPEYSLEGLMLKLKLQSFGHLMGRTDSFEKTLMLGKLKVGEEGDDRGWDGWMASPTQWAWVWVNSGSWWWTGRPGMLQSMRSQRVRHSWAIELNWTEPIE